MPLIRAQIALGATSNRPEDEATNTYHFNTTGNDESVLNNQLDLIEDLYAGVEPFAGLISSMGSDLATGNYEINLYDLADPLPRAPLATRAGFRNTAGIGGLPAEVALCVSFQGAPLSGSPQARRRGRVFIPWFREDANANGRPTTAAMDELVENFQNFGAAAEASLQVQWVVYSPTDDVGVPILTGWVDNSWDTQRRRGTSPTVRRIFPTP